MIFLKEHLGVRFRNDILRGVRLFLIAFAAILFGYWAFQMLRPGAEVQSAPQDAAPEASQPSAPTAEAATEPQKSEPRGLVVPAPPPVGVPGPPPAKSFRRSTLAADNTVPPPPIARPARTSTFSGREFETPQVALPASTSTAETGESNPGSPRTAVGYKSLLEANPTRPAVEPAPVPVAEQPVEKPKGNRFARALGKIFKGDKKETLPLTIQQPKQP